MLKGENLLCGDLYIIDVQVKGLDEGESKFDWCHLELIGP